MWRNLARKFWYGTSTEFSDRICLRSDLWENERPNGMCLSSTSPIRLVPDDFSGFNINNHYTKREQIGLLHVILIIQDIALSLYRVAFSIIASRATIGIKSETSDDNCFYFKIVSELAQVLWIREPIFSNSFSSGKPRRFLCANDLEMFLAC